MNRRSFVASAGALGAGAIAGCLGVLPGDTGSSASTGSLSDWLVVHGDYGERPAQFGAAATDYTTVFEESALPESYVEYKRDQAVPPWSDLDPERTHWLVDVYPGSTGVFHYLVQGGEFDVADVTDRVEVGGESWVDEHGGYALFQPEGTSSDHHFAIGDGRIVAMEPRDLEAGEDEDAAIRERIGTILDTGTGSRDPLGERYGPIQRVLDRVDGDLRTSVTVPRTGLESRPDFGQFEGVVARSESASVDGSRATNEQVYLFDDADAIDESAFRTYAEALEEYYENVAYEVDDSLVSVTYGASIREQFGAPPGEE